MRPFSGLHNPPLERTAAPVGFCAVERRACAAGAAQRLYVSRHEMLNDLKSLERPQHLVAYVTGRDEPLVDERIRQMNRKTPIWDLATGELWTPLSLPLRISITLGA